MKVVRVDKFCFDFGVTSVLCPVFKCLGIIVLIIIAWEEFPKKLPKSVPSRLGFLIFFNFLNFTSQIAF